ncbi:MAG: hypothetical protein IPG02_10000 [Ignavibacteria bacterium]|nr:hypothetical protein [Ignavibacteria bacterium]
MKIENGKWKIENGKWKMENENGKWKMEMESGKWKVEMEGLGCSRLQARSDVSKSGYSKRRAVAIFFCHPEQAERSACPQRMNDAYTLQACLPTDH